MNDDIMYSLGFAESLCADAATLYREVFTPPTRATVEIIPSIDHFELAVSDEVPSRILAWLH